MFLSHTNLSLSLRERERRGMKGSERRGFEFICNQVGIFTGIFPDFSLALTISHAPVKLIALSHGAVFSAITLHLGLETCFVGK